MWLGLSHSLDYKAFAHINECFAARCRDVVLNLARGLYLDECLLTIDPMDSGELKIDFPSRVPAE